MMLSNITTKFIKFRATRPTYLFSIKMQTNFTPKDFIPTTTQIHSIECPKSWSLLEHQEKLYAYYMARAAW